MSTAKRAKRLTLRAETRPSPRMVGRLGLILVGFSVLTFIFVAYQLWGTGLYAANEQSSLHAQFDRTLEKSARTPTLNPTPPAAAPGEPVAQIRIPKIGVDEIVVNGVSVADLRMGPGHYPESPWPLLNMYCNTYF